MTCFYDWKNWFLLLLSLIWKLGLVWPDNHHQSWQLLGMRQSETLGKFIRCGCVITQYVTIDAIKCCLIIKCLIKVSVFSTKHKTFYFCQFSDGFFRSKCVDFSVDCNWLTLSCENFPMSCHDDNFRLAFSSTLYNFVALNVDSIFHIIAAENHKMSAKYESQSVDWKRYRKFEKLTNDWKFQNLLKFWNKVCVWVPMYIAIMVCIQGLWCRK